MLKRIMGPAVPEPVIQSARAKYEQIGGASPNVGIAQAICTDLRRALNVPKAEESDQSSGSFEQPLIQHIEAGMCFTEPFLEDSLERLVAAGCERIVYLSMTAYESWAAWEGPYQRTVEAAKKLGITKVIKAPVFGINRHYVQTQTDLIEGALIKLQCDKLLEESVASKDGLIFVAHSLPVDDLLEMSARYEQQLLAAGSKIISSLSVPIETSILSYVSVGARGGTWLKPSLKDVLKRMSIWGIRSVAVCPLGFATDHMEVLYDLDIVAAQEAQELDLNFVRTSTLATAEKVNPALIAALVDSVQAALQKESD